MNERYQAAIAMLRSTTQRSPCYTSKTFLESPGHVLSAESRTTRRGPVSRRPVAGAGRRREREDAGDHRQDRASDRLRHSREAHRRDHLHQSGREGNEGARGKAALQRRQRRPDRLHLPFARPPHRPRRSEAPGTEAQLLDLRFRRCGADAGRHRQKHRSRGSAARAMADQQMEKCAAGSGRGRQGGRDRPGTAVVEGVRGLRAFAFRLSGGRFR